MKSTNLSIQVGFFVITRDLTLTSSKGNFPSFFLSDLSYHDTVSFCWEGLEINKICLLNMCASISVQGAVLEKATMFPCYLN